MLIRSRFKFLILGLALTCAVLALAFDYKPPDLQPAGHADKYPLHESHKDEGVSIALDPYGADKDSIFHVKFREHHILPVRLIVSNDTGQPISLADAVIEYTTAKKQKVEPLTKADLERILGSASEPQDRDGARIPLPLPLPRHKSQRLPKGTDEEIDYLQFKAEAVEPHNTQAGFIFFNVSGVPQPLVGTHVLFTGIRNADGQELFYFDIPLSKQ